MELLTASLRQAFKLALSLVPGQRHLRADLSGPREGESPEQGGKTTETRADHLSCGNFTPYGEEVIPARLSLFTALLAGHR